MVSFLGVLVILGSCMVLVTPIFALIALGNVRRQRRMRRTPTTPIGTWRSGSFVAAEGVVEYNAAGPQVGPLSGAACAWYTTTLSEINTTTGRPDRHSDAGTTPAWPVLTDGTGWVALDPRLLVDKWGSARNDMAVPTPVERTVEHYRRGAERPAWVTKGMADGLSYTGELVMTEVRLPHGRPVFVMGRTANGRIGPGSRAIITAGDRAGLVELTRGDIRWVWRAVPVFLLIGSVVTGGALWGMARLTG